MHSKSSTLLEIPEFTWLCLVVVRGETYDSCSAPEHMRFVWIYATYTQPTVKYVQWLNFVSSNFLSWWPSESSRAVLVVPRFYFPMTNTFWFPGSWYTYHRASESKYLWPFVLFVWWMGRLDSVIMMAKSLENSYWWHIVSLLSSNSQSCTLRRQHSSQSNIWTTSTTYFAMSIRKLGRHWYDQIVMTRANLVDTVWYLIIINWNYAK